MQEVLPVEFTKVDSELASKLFRNLRDNEKIYNDCFYELLHLTNTKAEI